MDKDKEPASRRKESGVSFESDEREYLALLDLCLAEWLSEEDERASKDL
jgi:hypothetical protein